MVTQNSKEFSDLRVVGGRSGTRRIGKVLRAVFSPDNYRYQGLIIARPDFLFMFKRSDRFLAHDAFEVQDGRVVASYERSAWDGLACKRLGINWDECLILEGTPVVTEIGEKLGVVRTVDFDSKTRNAMLVKITEGIASQAIIGTSDIPIDMILRHDGKNLVVTMPAAKIKAEGGLAAMAGEQAAIATHAIKEKAKEAQEAIGAISKKAGVGADKAIKSGSKALGKQLGKTKGMFKAFKDEYQKASARSDFGGSAKNSAKRPTKNPDKSLPKKEPRD